MGGFPCCITVHSAATVRGCYKVFEHHRFSPAARIVGALAIEGAFVFLMYKKGMLGKIKRIAVSLKKNVNPIPKARLIMGAAGVLIAAVFMVVIVTLNAANSLAHHK